MGILSLSLSGSIDLEFKLTSLKSTYSSLIFLQPSVRKVLKYHLSSILLNIPESTTILYFFTLNANISADK